MIYEVFRKNTVLPNYFPVKYPHRFSKICSRYPLFAYTVGLEVTLVNHKLNLEKSLPSL